MMNGFVQIQKYTGIFMIFGVVRLNFSRTITGKVAKSFRVA
jgi:hypothetical protein